MYFDYGKYLSENSFYQPMLSKMEEEIDYFLKRYKDDSRFLSGWGHSYFCNDDGGRLVYDIEKPSEHECSICGKIYRGFSYDSVHITFLRNEAVVNLIKAGILYKVKEEEKYIGVIKDIVSFYADNYDRFITHSKDNTLEGGKVSVKSGGKIMPQGLNEAIIMIRMINALELIKEKLDKNWLEEIKRKLFDKAYELLLPQKMLIHNIPCWINSAIAVIGFFYNDQEMIGEATKNPFNINEQLEKGVTENGFWYEGSIHYNFFALEGIMNYFVFAKAYGYQTSEDSEKIVFGMFEAAYKYAFDNDYFPNPSDGWPNINLKTYSYVYYMGYKVFGDKMLKYIAHIENSEIIRTQIPLSEPYYYMNKIPLERLLFLPNLSDFETEEAAKRTSASFEKFNCAILRNETFNVFFKYGHQTKSHAHPDKMNLEITVNDKVLSKDLSNSGYASKLCNKWHRTQAAHNTCIVNFAQSDIQTPGQLINFTNNSVEAKCAPYENTAYTRKIVLSENQLHDIFTVNCNNISTIDYFFHLENRVERKNLNLVKTSDIAEYESITDVYEIKNDGEVSLQNSLALLNLEIEKDAKIYLAETYNNPADCMRDTIIIRKRAIAACFKMNITCIM